MQITNTQSYIIFASIWVPFWDQKCSENHLENKPEIRCKKSSGKGTENGSQKEHPAGVFLDLAVLLILEGCPLHNINFYGWHASQSWSPEIPKSGELCKRETRNDPKWTPKGSKRGQQLKTICFKKALKTFALEGRFCFQLSSNAWKSDKNFWLFDVFNKIVVICCRGVTVALRSCDTLVTNFQKSEDPPSRSPILNPPSVLKFSNSEVLFTNFGTSIMKVKRLFHRWVSGRGEVGKRTSDLIGFN